VPKLKKELWDAANNPRKVSANLLREEDVHDYELGCSAVLVVTVPRASRELRPIYVNGDLMGGAYKRNWEGDYRCAPREVRAMLRDQMDDGMDSEVAEGQPMADLDRDSVRAYRRRYDVRHEGSAWVGLPDDAFLQRIGAAREDGGGTLRPTRAGLLMFGQEWRILHEYPDYFLDYREHMDPSVRWTDRIESQSGDWSGNVFDFFSRVSAKLLLDLKKPFRLEGMVRQDTTPVHDAVREALGNCLANADFMQPWSVVVEKWPDRLVLANPGTIICGKAQMLKGGVSQPRNRGIFRMLNLIGVGEHAGSGVPDILAAWDRAGYEAPTVEEQFGAGVPDRTTLTLPLVEAGLGASMATGGYAGGHAGEQADLFDATLRFCSVPRTRNEIREHLGLQSRRYVLEEVIRPLLESGRLAQTIPDKPRSPNQRYVRIDIGT
jgi:predicted HTH transcriptional regulator